MKLLLLAILLLVPGSLGLFLLVT